MSLTPDQARALWDAGGFALLEGLPAGSEAGIDGTMNAIRSFAGYKFVPPGFHLLVWNTQKEFPAEKMDELVSPGAAALPPAQAAAEGLGFPLRVAYPHHYAPKERTRIAYDAAAETTKVTSVDDAVLPTLDAQMAAYPCASLEKWKALTSAISPKVVKHVLGNLDVVDSLTGEAGGDEIGALREALGAKGKDKEGKEQDVAEGKESTEGTEATSPQAAGASASDEGATRTTAAATSSSTAASTSKASETEKSQPVLQYPVFELKRSWPAHATGDELSRWSRDKSALFARVCKEVGGPQALLGHLQLSFALLTNVWNFASLGAYKRLFSLFAQSGAAMAGTCPPDFFDAKAVEDVQKAYIALLGTIAAQLRSLPVTAFDTELPDLDTFYLTQLDHLRKNLGAALAEKRWWGLAKRVATDWAALQKAGRERGWAIGDMRMGDEDSDEEEGEYAPMVVET